MTDPIALRAPYRTRIAEHPAASLIGRAPDDVCAALIGATTEGVSARRKARRLPRPDPVLWQDDIELVHEVLDAAITETLTRPEREPALYADLGRLMPLPDDE
jgi:hypothetical protein